MFLTPLQPRLSAGLVWFLPKEGSFPWAWASQSTGEAEHISRPPFMSECLMAEGAVDFKKTDNVTSVRRITTYSVPSFT